MKEWLFCQSFAVLGGYLLDLVLGDPNYSFHPVRLIGHLISKVERRLRTGKSLSHKKEFYYGCLLFVIVVSIATLLPLAALLIAYQVHLVLGFLLELVFCYQLIATKCLKKESMKVYHALEKKDIEEAKNHLSMIVGRDTKYLEEEGIAKAAVETVAENASDGVVAPLFYMAIGGAVFGFCYKAINTLDSMVGYKNETYLYFGRCSAKADDVVNYFPSRISGLLMVVASALIGLNYKKSVQIYRRDGRNHASPNSAQTEAACAGALNVQLAGDAYYFGVRYEKPFIGDKIRTIEHKDIVRANHLLYMTSVLAVVCFLGIRLLMI